MLTVIPFTKNVLEEFVMQATTDPIFHTGSTACSRGNVLKVLYK